MIKKAKSSIFILKKKKKLLMNFGPFLVTFFNSLLFSLVPCFCSPIPKSRLVGRIYCVRVPATSEIGDWCSMSIISQLVQPNSGKIPFSDLYVCRHVCTVLTYVGWHVEEGKWNNTYYLHMIPTYIHLYHTLLLPESYIFNSLGKDS